MIAKQLILYYFISRSQRHFVQPMIAEAFAEWNAFANGKYLQK